MAVLSRPWPFYQGRSSGLHTQSVYQQPGQAIFSKSRSSSSFIKARSNGRFIKALAVLSRQKQPRCHTCRFEPRIANSILSFTISFSAAGPSHFQQKPAQWPFYQGRPARWPFYQGLAVTARKVAMFISLSEFYQGRQAQWPFYQGQPSPMAALSRLASANGRFIKRATLSKL